jgi:hypothetical protein
MQDIYEHYKNLLIYQYKGKAKAESLIKLIVDTFYNDNILQDIQEAFDIDTAVGKQLDVLGKIIGVDRNYFGIELKAGVYFAVALNSQSETDVNKGSQLSPVSGSVVNNTSFVNGSNLLDDETYRFILKLKIIYNNTNCSIGEITDMLYQFFQNDVEMTTAGNMKMIYWIKNKDNVKATIAKRKGCFPRPAGVKIDFIVSQDVPYFAVALNPQSQTDLYKGSQITKIEGTVLTNQQIIS